MPGECGKPNKLVQGVGVMARKAKDTDKDTRRGHNEGTARFNDSRDRWEARFSYTDPRDNEVKRKMFTAESRPKALAKGREFIKSLEDGLLPDADKLTLEVWIDRWLEDYAKPKVRIKSWEKYRSSLAYVKNSKFAKVFLPRIKAPDLQSFFNQLLIDGGREKVTIIEGKEVKEKKGLSSSTVRGVRRYLTLCLDQALKSGLLVRNPVKATIQPKLITEEIHPLSVEQAESLKAVAKVTGEVPNTVILLALNTGMRLGEVFGLMWSDIDMTKGTIHVQRSLVTSTTKGQIFEDPKTAKSKRKIPIPKTVLKELQKYKKWQEWQQHLLGDRWTDMGLVIANITGRPYDTSNFTSRVFKKMLDNAGIDRGFKFHDLRHTHATLLLRQGVNAKVVSDRLGHSTITMTLDTYSHLLPDMQETAVSALEALFPKEKAR